MGTATVNYNGAGTGRRTDMADYVMPDFSPLWEPELTYLPNGWAVAIADVWPELAEAMFALNADEQRPIVDHRVERMAGDMRNGYWLLIHQGVAFNRRGRLSDGQKRLRAVILSGAVARMLVFFGAGDLAEMQVFDANQQRGALDACHVSGLKVKADAMATARHVVRFGASVGANPRVLTNAESVRIMGLWNHDLEAVCGWTTHPKVPGLDRAPVRAAVFAAMLSGVDRAVAERFCLVAAEKVPSTGDPADLAATKLRHWIGALKVTGRGGSSLIQEIYNKTTYCVSKAVEGEEFGRLPKTQSPLYTVVLPEFLHTPAPAADLVR